MRIGVKPAKTAEAIFGSYQWPKIELLSAVLATAKRDETGQVAWMWQTLDVQQKTKACDEDADGFVNYPLACGEVEAAALFKETAAGIYRTSLRSKGDVNVAKVAVRDAIMSVCGPERTTQVLSLSSQARAASCLTFSSLYLSSSTFEQI